VDIKKSQIFSLDGFKIGVIGLATKNTPSTSSNDFSKMKFKDYFEITKKLSKHLKK